MTTLTADEFLRKLSNRWRFNQSVRWTDVPPFLPSSTSDTALKFICTFGGRDKTLFEFGTWIGRSALAFSQNYSKVVTIDFASASDIKYSYKGFRPGQLVEGCSNVERITANSLEYDFAALKDRFDVVYVDGNHTTEGTLKDLESARSISRETGLIFVDDYNNPTMGVTAAIDSFSGLEKLWLKDINQVVLVRKI